MKKRVKGFEQYVIDSIEGTVYNTETKRYVGWKNHSGYLTVSLSNNGKKYTCRVNRLIAEYFVPNPESKSEVNYIDGDKTNNSAKNLMWAGRKNNTGNNYPFKHTPKAVEVSKDGFKKVYPSINEAERQLGIYKNGLRNVVNGWQKCANGYAATFITTKTAQHN